MGRPDLTFKRLLFDPTAYPRLVWQIDKRAVLLPISLELGLVGVSVLVGIETDLLTGIKIYAIARLMLAASTLFHSPSSS